MTIDPMLINREDMGPEDFSAHCRYCGVEIWPDEGLWKSEDNDPDCGLRARTTHSPVATSFNELNK